MTSLGHEQPRLRGDGGEADGRDGDDPSRAQLMRVMLSELSEFRRTAMALATPAIDTGRMTQFFTDSASGSRFRPVRGLLCVTLASP